MAKRRGCMGRVLALAIGLPLLVAVSSVLFLVGLCGLGLAFGPTEEEMAQMELERSAREARAEESRRQRDAEQAAAEQARWDALPATERAFCDALTEHARLYSEAPNDLKRSAVRGARGKALLAAVPGGRVEKWTATVKTLTTTSEGNAVLEMTLPCADFGIGTMNNELSDIGTGTLIPISSAAFQSLSDMGPGAVLWFSGTLVRDDARIDGWYETSLTESGSMSGGYFLVKIAGS